MNKARPGPASKCSMWPIPRIRGSCPTSTPPARNRAERPARAYVGWIDGGFVILDIADKAHPKLIAHRSWQSQNVGFAHTVLPIPSRGLAIQTEEAVETNCKDWPKRDWVWDISNEKAP